MDGRSYGDGISRRCRLLLLLLLPVLGAGICHYGKKRVVVWEGNGDEAGGRI